MAWENPKQNWGQLGQTVPTADDFNRIEGNIQELRNVVEGVESDQTLDMHIASLMPHRFTDGNKIYRWGLSVSNGVVMFNYEEVTS